MLRVAVIGDIGGQYQELIKALKNLGMKDDNTLPSDLTIIQIGDLVHRGPESVKVVDFVYEQVFKNDNWIQLIGNHELYYLTNPRIFDWDDEISEESQIKIKEMWDKNKFIFSAGLIDDFEERYLLTHAGITFNFWERRLGQPNDLEKTVNVINKMKSSDLDSLLVAGTMLNSSDVNLNAGPIWAEATEELLLSWKNQTIEMPFNQIHGHSNSYDWENLKFKNNLISPEDTLVNALARHVFINVSNNKMIEIDPNHGYEPAKNWSPLIFENITKIYY